MFCENNESNRTEPNRTHYIQTNFFVIVAMFIFRSTITSSKRNSENENH